MQAEFQVYPGDKGEKKHSRRYFTEDKDFPLSDIYLRRPFSSDKDRVVITIKLATD